MAAEFERWASKKLYAKEINFFLSIYLEFYSALTHSSNAILDERYRSYGAHSKHKQNRRQRPQLVGFWMATTRMALAKEVVVVVVVGCKRMRESRPRIGKHLEDDDEEELGTFFGSKD
ncbi:hypothetical protein H5410_013198 [Solanum commersonii]|uniref:Uncharacterized protein n=1 Tax=Solanum commersonii TaxID=4109 RepID=A0A9J6AU85_SOLCO|nr:hypothetical protein H5410_013198 [Solanum commersonii]